MISETKVVELVEFIGVGIGSQHFDETYWTQYLGVSKSTLESILSYEGFGWCTGCGMLTDVWDAFNESLCMVCILEEEDEQAFD